MGDGRSCTTIEKGVGTYMLLDYAINVQLSEGKTDNVDLTWTITTPDWKNYLGIEDGSEDDIKSIRVNNPPDKPMNITFKVTAAYHDIENQTITDYGEIGEYTALIGAPISEGSATDTPAFSSGDNATGTIKINLNGASEITDRDTSLMGIRDVGNSKALTSTDQQLDYLTITGYHETTGGLSLDISFSSAQLAGAYKLDTDPKNAHKTGQVEITPKKDTNSTDAALTVDESKGWYFPDEGLTITKEIWVCHPQLFVTTSEGSTSDKKISP